MCSADGKAHEFSISSSFDTSPDLAPCAGQVAGRHRAVPSVTLDKVIHFRGAEPHETLYTNMTELVKHETRDFAKKHTGQTKGRFAGAYEKIDDEKQKSACKKQKDVLPL